MLCTLRYIYLHCFYYLDYHIPNYMCTCVNKIFFIVNGQNSTRKLSFALTVNEKYKSRVLFLFFINVGYCESNSMYSYQLLDYKFS